MTTIENREFKTNIRGVWWLIGTIFTVCSFSLWHFFNLNSEQKLIRSEQSKDRQLFFESRAIENKAYEKRIERLEKDIDDLKTILMRNGNTK